MVDRVYGHVPDCPVGTTFANRKAAQAAGVHRPGQAGISGGVDGADSIVVSGGYVDDEDYGDELIYTGHGGRNDTTGRQDADQELTRGNLGLVRSQLDDRPVRVVRGAAGDPEYSPGRGFRYDGLFKVVDHWHETGRDGYLIWRYRLVRLLGDDFPSGVEEVGNDVPEPSTTPQDGPVPRKSTSGDRAVRSAAVRSKVLGWHDYTCQICGTRLMTAAGPSAVGAHIRGLGRPHNGPDHETNVLCLCPNDHHLFDNGALYVDAGLKVWNALTGAVVGPLRTAAKHAIDPVYLEYHRDHLPVLK